MSQRIDLPYTAPVYVTVNLADGHVERVYLDDEAVTLDKAEPVVCVDTAEAQDAPDETEYKAGAEVVVEARALTVLSRPPADRTTGRRR